MGEGLVTGAEITQRQWHHQSPPQYRWQCIKSGKLEPTAQPAGILRGRRVIWLVYTSSGHPRWFLLLPGSWSVLRAHFATWLVWEWPHLLLILGWRKGGLGNRFRGLLEAILNCLPLCLKDLPAGCSVSVWEKLLRQHHFKEWYLCYRCLYGDSVFVCLFVLERYILSLSQALLVSYETLDILLLQTSVSLSVKWG